MYNKPVITYHPPMRTCWVLPDIDYWWAIAVLKPTIKNDITTRKKFQKSFNNFFAKLHITSLYTKNIDTT